RRLLAGQPVATLSSGIARSGVPLPGDQRRGAAGVADVAAPVAQTVDPGPQAVPGVRPGNAEVRAVREPPRGPLPARTRRDDGAGGQQPVAVRAAGGAGPARLRGPRSGGDARRPQLPADRRAAVRADAQPALVVLVPPGSRGIGVGLTTASVFSASGKHRHLPAPNRCSTWTACSSGAANDSSTVSTGNRLTRYNCARRAACAH